MYNDWGFSLDNVFDFGNQPVMRKQKNLKIKPQRQFNPFLEGLDISSVDMNISSFKPKNRNYVQNDVLEGNFFKYIPNIGTERPPRGYGKESKKSKARRTVSQKDSSALYGLEGLENAVEDSYENFEKSGRKLRKHITSRAKGSKRFGVRTFTKTGVKVESGSALSGLKTKIKAYQARRKVSGTLQPDYSTNIGFDRSREISSTYGKVTSDVPEQKYDYEEKNKEKWR